jgi:TolB-like protein/tRNA A-37 threonylcarbamoyl transferase component Bud32/Tfp pilus assembly protein PilF
MAELLARLRAALADRYAIDRELGRGGAATVYLAQDLRHSRSVAIKVLRPELAAALGAERFLREIEIAARLTHPHILPLHDSGEAAGFLYYVMPFVEGESLRDRLNREAQLPVEEAVRIAREVASALSYAHSHDVVHRDIKPENILLSGGEAVVADFGIARAIVAAGTETLTDTGLTVGTPGYMSPEQATGAMRLDGRSDVYSLGCVLYEMLAGHPPFLGTTAQEILARHSLDPVPPLRTIRPELLLSLERAVLKALAKSPADRFPSAAAFGESLTQTGTPPSLARRAARLTVFVAAGVAALVAGYVLLTRRPGSSGEPARSIAVLPFVNIGADPANEPFSDGMSEELITALAKIAELRVTARTSAFSFKGKAVDVREIGSKLNVNYVLAGSVRRAGPQLRVSAQLINAATGYHLWSDEYDRDARDVFAVQDEIARAIVGALRVKLSGAANAALVKPPTENPEAHDLYLKGRYFFAKRDSASLRKAADYFERAIQQDSSYALAWSGLGDAYSHTGVFGYVPPRAVYAKAKAAALRALALDSALAQAHTSLGFITLFYDWDWPTAGRHFDRALALDPRYPDAHLFHGWYFVATNRMEDAIREVQTAVNLDPFSSVNNARLASILFLARRYDDVLAQSRRVMELDSMFQGHVGRAELARAYLWLGRCAESLAALEGSPGLAVVMWRGLLGYTYARCGRRAQALAELARLRAEARKGRYVSHYALAMIHAGLADNEEALAELDSAYVERAWPMFTLRVDPTFDSLRPDPRFVRLLKKVGLVS